MDDIQQLAAVLHEQDGEFCQPFTTEAQEPGWPGGHPVAMHNSQAAAILAGLRAARIAVGSLDAAWAEAEAALSAKWRLALRTNGRGTYVAEALPPFLPYDEWLEARVEQYDDSPAAAVRALAAKLRG